MTKKTLSEKKTELCELHSQAIREMKEYFKSKRKELEKRNGKK